jgi:SAM-dependent methyltransferase
MGKEGVGMDDMARGFEERREAGRKFADSLDRSGFENDVGRKDFFRSVYDNAAGDPAAIPWADMEPKRTLLEWLENHPSHEGEAIDIGCGLGDNAEAIASYGYQTIGFDFSEQAIEWASQRFFRSAVDYRTADLLNLPTPWRGRFQLVHECYTLQSLSPTTLSRTIPATASLVAPDGILLVYARVRQDGAEADGPPWPLEMSQAMSFEHYGLVLENREDFTICKREREIPHIFCVWRRPA